MLLAGCEAAPKAAAPPAKAERAEASAVEVAAPGPPTDEQIAAAIDHRIYRNIAAMEAGGAIVEPDMMRSVVRKSECRFVAQSRSRAHCRYEYHRSPDNGRSYEEAVEWVAWQKDWEALSGTFVHVREPGPSGAPGQTRWQEAQAPA